MTGGMPLSTGTGSTVQVTSSVEAGFGSKGADCQIEGSHRCLASIAAELKDTTTLPASRGSPASESVSTKRMILRRFFWLGWYLGEDGVLGPIVQITRRGFCGAITDEAADSTTDQAADGRADSGSDSSPDPGATRADGLAAA